MIDIVTKQRFWLFSFFSLWMTAAVCIPGSTASGVVCWVLSVIYAGAAIYQVRAYLK